MHYLEFLKSKGLSDRELDVAELRLVFTTIADISKDLYVAESTVKGHLGNIYKKVGAKSYLGFYKLMFELGYFNNDVFNEIKNKRFLMLLHRG